MNEIIIWIKNIASIIGLIISIYTWIIALKLRKEQRKQQELMSQCINLILVSQKGKIILPYAPRRSQLNRAELLGILGMYSKTGRFSLMSLAEIFTGGLFEQVLSGKMNKIEINCSEEEMSQF